MDRRHGSEARALAAAMLVLFISGPLAAQTPAARNNVDRKIGNIPLDSGISFRFYTFRDLLDTAVRELSAWRT